MNELFVKEFSFEFKKRIPFFRSFYYDFVQINLIG